jgi:putative endonuclease
VFVEVKARDGDEFGGGAAAVTAWKRRRITYMAVDYLSRHRLHDQPCRFDVVAIDVVDGRTRVEVYRHAFDSTD